MFGKQKKELAAVQNQLKATEEKLEAVQNSVDPFNTGVRARIAAALSGGYDFADTLHNIYLDFGYPQSLDFFKFWNMYRRLGIAKNIVELPVETSWMTEPCIEGPEAFKTEVDKLIEQLRLWQRLKGLDNRQRVGRYAGLFVRVRDNKKPDQPIEGKLNGVGSVMQVVPLYEGQLEVLETDNDPTSERYTLPKMYLFQGAGVGDRNEKQGDSFSIHPDRIISAAEGADNGGIYGIPALEGCYNSLMDIRKVIGGGAEGFYKNAAQNIMFELKDAASAKNNADLLEKFNEQYDEFSRNRFRRAMWTPGLEAKTLDSTMIQSKEFFNNALNDCAASSKIPATLLVGQQTGRLASQEDSRGFLAGINSRRQNFVSEMVMDTIDWFVKYGVLPAAEYEVEWDDLLALSDQEKLDNALKMADTNAKQFQSGGTTPFTGEEIREAAGFDREEEFEEGDELLEDLDGEENDG
jgi:hypothetical protein